ncbi:superoxide dismutase [Rhodoligotrophos defluvii]|uniref:superoxide dismutase n=1 Tax=Rhodoligotrophos defluvii TaxID=2561934 RepID=UPI001EF14908|nr:superoxide dismutase [Rhodoligotrophos defluvii]
MHKREFLLGMSAVLGLAPFAVFARQTPLAAQEQATFSLDPLPYAADALEPVIDRQTMVLHHDKHHQAYVDALNKAVAEDSELAGRSLEELLADAGNLPDVVRNNAGGHWNHTFFWQIMAPPANSGSPSPELAEAIEQSFGSMDEMKAAFEAAGKGRFGSGWVWLIVREDGTLAITSTPNQDNPLMDVAEEQGTPILGNDLWEHAYYLKYNNRRADYLKAWWQVVNWPEVSKRYDAAIEAAD